MAVSRTIYYLAPVKERQKIVLPLLRLLHSSKEVERVTLENLSVLARDSPVRQRSYSHLSDTKTTPKGNAPTSRFASLHPVLGYYPGEAG